MLDMFFADAKCTNFSILPSKASSKFKPRATMIASTVTWARMLLAGVRYLMTWCNFIGRGINGEWNRVKRRKAFELEIFSWLDLPTDMVELILSKLQFEDNAKLACVCKSWRDIIQTLPAIYPVGKVPLLLHVKSRGEEGKRPIFHYHSLSLNRTFQLDFPLDLRGCEIISAKDGTLLIYNPNPNVMKMKMVDPLADYTVDFPRITSNIFFSGAAIGLHNKCYTIFLIDTSHDNQVTVHLCGKSSWELDLVYSNGNKSFHMSSNPVYCDGRFYCLGTKGDIVGVFDLLERTWQLHSVEFSNKHDDDDDDDILCCCCCYYLVGWINTVMAVQVKNNGSGINLFLLDRKKMVWKETDDLCGRSVFLGSTVSVMSRPIAKRLQNRVFLPHSHQDEPKTVMVAGQAFSPDRIYFSSVPSDPISSWRKDHAATTMCCCNNSGEESVFLGSTRSQKYCTIWYQPFFEGLNDA